MGSRHSLPLQPTFSPNAVPQMFSRQKTDVANTRGTCSLDSHVLETIIRVKLLKTYWLQMLLPCIKVCIQLEGLLLLVYSPMFTLTCAVITGGSVRVQKKTYLGF